MTAASDAIHVLHVDDEPGFASTAAAFLEREEERISVETASDASEGLDRLSADIDCIVSDYDMPGNNGIDFLEAVRAEYPDLPFILYTGKGSEEVASEAISAGVTEYLQKESGTSQYTVLANRIRNAVEKHYTQVELSDRERRLNLFFEQSPFGVIEWDESFTFVRQNDEARSILGYSSDDLAGKSWEALIPESAEVQVANVVDSILEDEGGYHSINQNVRKDGERLTCEWHNRVVTGTDGDVVAIFSQFQDITTRIERKRELERYEAYLANSTDIITVLDEAGTVVYESPSVARILGYDPGEIVGQNGFDFIHPDDLEAVLAGFEDLVTGAAETVTVESRFRTADGSWCWLEIHGRNLLDDETVNGILTNNREITDRKVEEQKRERIIERVTDAIVEVDEDWTFSLVNQQAERLYDMDASSLIGRNFWDVLPEVADEEFADEYRSVMETREPASFTEYYAGLDRWFEINAYPDASGGIALYFVDVTERRQREDELERSNALLSTLFDTLPVGVLAEDTERNVLAINERMVELFDLSGTPGAFEGADCRELADQISEAFDDPEQFRDRITELVDAREPTTNERISLRDGRTVQRSHRPLSFPSGQGNLWVYQDITAQRTRERELQEEQQFVKAIFNALSDLLYTIDTAGYPLRWNEQLETVTGYSAAEIEAMHFSEFIPADAVDDVVSQFQTILEDRTAVTIESALETKDGERIPFEYTGAPLEDPDGTLRGITGVGRDISDREKRAEQLKSLNDRSHDLLNADSRAAVAEIGVAAARDVLGLSLTSIHLYDEDVDGLVPVASTAAVFDLLGEPPTFEPGDSIAWRAYRDGDALALDHVQADPDVHNPDTPIESELFLPLEAYGILVAGSTSPEAFTEQDRALGDLWAGNIVTALDQIDQTRKLRAREQELTRQNERLEQFAGIVSHDLRNPISLASGQLELARDDCASEHHDAIEDALDRMERIVEDVLWLAREGADVGSTRPVSLSVATEDAWTMVAGWAAGAELIREDEDRWNRIICDADRLHQLLENLFANAIDHGGPDVVVTVGQLPDGIYVADDGPGIPPEEREAVFEGGYSTAEDSTGFGLRIVKQIVDGHGWDVAVTESAGGGARFEITGIEFVEE